MSMQMPQTLGERQKAAAFIRETLNRERLPNGWLIYQLEREGFRISPSYLVDGLALRASSQKIAEFLSRSVRICARYTRLWNSTEPAEGSPHIADAYCREHRDDYIAWHMKKYGCRPANY